MVTLYNTTIVHRYKVPGYLELRSAFGDREMACPYQYQLASSKANGLLWSTRPGEASVATHHVANHQNYKKVSYHSCETPKHSAAERRTLYRGKALLPRRDSRGAPSLVRLKSTEISCLSSQAATLLCKQGPACDLERVALEN